MKTQLQPTAHPLQMNGPTRYYLIAVEPGSQADRTVDRIVHGLNSDMFQGHIQTETCLAPTLAYALAKMAYLAGLAAMLLMHLKAAFEDKKSA